MGSRSDQLIGLNSRAMALLKGHQILQHTEVVMRAYPDGHVQIDKPIPVYKHSIKKEGYGGFTGMFDDIYQLHRYTLSSGYVYYEEVQTSPWSSGPVFFLALQDEKGEWVKESLWTDEEINDHIGIVKEKEDWGTDGSD